MGFFDFFKGKKKVEQPKPTYQRPQDDFNIVPSRDGTLTCSYTEANPKPGQDYDTTIVVISKLIDQINNRILYRCKVAWHGDTIFTDEHGNPEFDYTDVIASIDPNLMQSDPQYARLAMLGLFNKNIVNSYIENAMKTASELAEERQNPNDFAFYPHGRYIGNIEINEKGELKKNFDPQIGKVFHFDPEMVEERNAYKQKLAKRAEISANKAELYKQIAKLEQESKQLEISE